MDMQTGLAHTEDYADEHSDLWGYARSCGFRPKLAGYEGPQTLVLSAKRAQEGRAWRTFDYLTVNTEILAWVMRLWAPLDCEDDAYNIVESAGMPMEGGGLSTSLRYFARFGELIGA